MHSSENDGLDSTRFTNAPFANTQVVDDGQAWEELDVFLRSGKNKPALACGTECRFIRCAFCATVLTVVIRASRKFALCKGMSYGWLPHAKSSHPARPVCDDPACLQFAEFHVAMEHGEIVHLVEFADGTGGYKKIATAKPPVIPSAKQRKQRSQERRQRRKQRQQEQETIW